MKPDRQLPPFAASAVVRFQADGSASSLNDQVAVEEPLEIRIGNRPFVVTMRTPGNDEELAAGFMTSEGFTNSKADFREIDRCPLSSNPENTIRIRFGDKLDEKSIESRRYSAVSSSCGICGKTSIDAIGSSFSAIESKLKVNRRLLFELPERLREKQVVFDRTGGLHSSGLFDRDGKLICLREDVGRHNAIDKIAGYMAMHKISPKGKSFYTTGRLTSEMVIKAVQMEIPILISRSGFTAWGVELAKQANLTLIGRARGKRFVALSGQERIVYDSDPEQIDDEPERLRRKGGRDDDAA